MKEINITRRPLISIAMCTYNGEQFLREQLDSLVAQDYPNLEIIITDDKSSDSTFSILQEYSNTHKNITVIRNETNLGFIRNFEKSISLCKGEFIALCDQDDIWFSDKISTLEQEIGEHTLIYSRTCLIDTTNTPQGDFLPLVNRLEGSCYRELLTGNCVTGHTCMFPRSLLSHAMPFPEGIDFHDHWIAFVAAKSGSIRYLNKALSSYRQHENNITISLSHKKTKRRKSVKDRLEKHKKNKSVLLNSYRRLTAWQELNLLSSDDKELMSYIAHQFKRSCWLYRNKRLYKFIKDRPELLELSKSPQRYHNHLCRGSMFRF